jgi:hypothetical protein
MKKNKLFERGLELKEEVFGAKAGFINPREVSPIMPLWFFSLFLVIVGVFFIDLWASILITVNWLVLNYAFFNAQVKL